MSRNSAQVIIFFSRGKFCVRTRRRKYLMPRTLETLLEYLRFLSKHTHSGHADGPHEFIISSRTRYNHDRNCNQILWSLKVLQIAQIVSGSRDARSLTLYDLIFFLRKIKKFLVCEEIILLWDDFITFSEWNFSSAQRHALHWCRHCFGWR